MANEKPWIWNSCCFVSSLVCFPFLSLFPLNVQFQVRLLALGGSAHLYEAVGPCARWLQGTRLTLGNRGSGDVISASVVGAAGVIAPLTWRTAATMLPQMLYRVILYQIPEIFLRPFYSRLFLRAVGGGAEPKLWNALPPRILNTLTSLFIFMLKAHLSARRRTAAVCSVLSLDIFQLYLVCFDCLLFFFCSF